MLIAPLPDSLRPAPVGQWTPVYHPVQDVFRGTLALHGRSNDSEEDEPLEATAVDGVFSVYYEE